MSVVASNRARLAVKRRWWLALATVVVLGIAAATQGWWFPPLRNWRTAEMRRGNAAPPGAEAGEADEHAGHDHDHAAHEHAGHVESNALELSAQARRSMGLQVGTIELRAFERTIAIPGIVVERPGRSTVQVTAPLTGVVVKIAATQGEAVEPGQLLFEMRLTHEELVQAQADFLRTTEELDVVGREIDRLQKVSEGTIAGKTLLERKYEQQKQQALLRAQRQALLLHGLSEDQVANIAASRTLLSRLVVTVPEPDESDNTGNRPVYQIQELHAERGKHVTAGDTLASLTDHAELFLEGRAFEKDLVQINSAVANGWKLSAVLDIEGQPPEIVSELNILFVAGKIAVNSRTIDFYVTLPNSVLRDVTANGRRFIDWRFKPGQRWEVLVPVERLEDRIVLPANAVAMEGAESYIFQANGDHFDRRPVHVEYRDRLSAVLANDGSIFPGDQVALSGAQQLQLALKNKSGGAIDPHAGHNH